MSYWLSILIDMAIGNWYDWINQFLMLIFIDWLRLVSCFYCSWFFFLDQFTIFLRKLKGRGAFPCIFKLEKSNRLDKITQTLIMNVKTINKYCNVVLYRIGQLFMPGCLSQELSSTAVPQATVTFSNSCLIWSIFHSIILHSTVN